jgi:ribosomal protein S18 acetylase RimI-like enzyme
MPDRSSIVIETAAVVDDELVDAINRLLPQLSTGRMPTRDELGEMLHSSCTTLLLARDSEQNSRVVGILALAIFRIPSGVRAWIEDVIVDEAVRGKGIGEALSREALRIALERGARTVELTSRPIRQAANKLYMKIGFVPRDTNVYRYTNPKK